MLMCIYEVPMLVLAIVDGKCMNILLDKKTSVFDIQNIKKKNRTYKECENKNKNDFTERSDHGIYLHVLPLAL